MNKEVKFLQTGDIHLETSFKDMGFSLEMARRRRNELKEVFSRIIKVAKEERVDIILITGDLFEHQSSTKSLMRFLQKKFCRIPQIKIFITPGNQDPALPDSFYRSFPWPQNVHIFLKEAWEYVDLPRFNLRVHGLGWNQWEIKRPLLRELKIDSNDKTNLVMLHGDSFGQLGESICLPVSESDLRSTKAEYVALGHRHQTHRIPGKGKIIAHYAGSPEPLNFGEPGEHGVILGTLNKTDVHLKFKPIAKRKFIQNNIRVKSNHTLEEICNNIKNSVDKEERKNNIYSFKLIGESDESIGVNSELIKEKLINDFFYLEINDCTIPDYDLESLIRENLHTAVGIFTLKMKDEIDRAKGNNQEILKNSLYYGLDSLLGKEVNVR